MVQLLVFLNLSNLFDNIIVIDTHDAESKRDAVLQRLSEQRAMINFAQAEFGIEELHFISFKVEGRC